MKALKAALEKMFADKTWESLIVVVEAICKLVFGIVAEEEELDYPTTAA